MRKVIFVNRPHPILQQELHAAGYECELAIDESKSSIQNRIESYYGLVINSRFLLDKPFLEKATSLKFIARVGSGMESIDTEYAQQRGILCFNSPEGNRDAVGEHTIGLLLSVMNNIPRANQQVRELQWLRTANSGAEIKGKTVGIIGYGNMGAAFAQRLAGFEATVIAYDKYKKNYSDQYVKEVSLDELQQSADIISFHVPLTKETHYYLDKDFIKKCQKPFWLLNTSRGKVVHTAELVKGLKSGNILGAGLDVLEYEDVSFDNMGMDSIPYPLKDLFACENVVFTPHVAGWTSESKYKLAKVLAEKIIAAFPF